MLSLTAAERRSGAMALRKMPDTCDLWKGGSTRNSSGGVIAGQKTYLARSVKCQVQARTREPREEQTGGEASAMKTFVLLLPLGTTIEAGAFAVVAGVTYSVISHDAGRSFGTEIIAECIRMDDGA